MKTPLQRCCAALLAAIVLIAPAARGQASLSEAELKAALVFNFARYVDWPERAFAAPDSPFVLCVVGPERYGAAFAALEGRTMAGRPVRVRQAVASDDTRGCHVAFFSEAPRQGPATLRAMASQPTLTVSDVEGFIDSGGAIGIVQGEERLQFEVNRDALGRAQLKASSQLLRLARAIIGKGG